MRRTVRLPKARPSPYKAAASARGTRHGDQYHRERDGALAGAGCAPSFAPIHRSGGAGGQGRAGHHARRRLLAVGQRGQPHPGWHVGPVVRERRLRPCRAGRGGAAPDGDPAVLQHLFPMHDAGPDRAGGAAGGDRARVRPGVLRELRLRGQRHGGQAGPVFLEAAWPAAKADHDRAHLRLPRRDARRRQPVRPAQHAPAVRPAAGRLRARACPLLVRRRWRAHARGIRAARGAGPGAEDPGARAGAGRRVHRRAGAGRRRRDHPAGWVLGRDPAHLPASTTCC